MKGKRGKGEWRLRGRTVDRKDEVRIVNSVCARDREKRER